MNEKEKEIQEEENSNTEVSEVSKTEEVAPKTETTEVSSDKKEESIAKSESNESLANRKFAEGAKKKEKEILSTLGVASIEEAKALIQSAKEQGANYKELAAKSICTDLDVKKEFREDVIDIVKGKGLEITEENVKAILSKHPEWVLKADESDTPVVEIGKVGGKGQPQEIDGKEYVHNLFK